MTRVNVRELMSGHVLTVEEHQTAQEIAKQMHRHDIGFVPVMSGGKVVGVVTDRDLVLRVLAENKPYDTAVNQIMSRSIDSIDIDATADEAAVLMAKKEIRRLLVMEQGKLAGVITLGDLANDAQLQNESAKALHAISAHDTR
jgi:CBS domain-containing protein